MSTLPPQTAHTEYPPDQETAQRRFLHGYPSYRRTAILDQLRAAEYNRLDQTGHTYLDYTGGGVYAQSQLRRHLALLEENVFGNPHSNNPTSAAMTDLVEGARRYILNYFNAPAEEYTLIFTPNASGALKHVGESYPFAKGSRYLLTFDNHNSVNGIRQFAQARGAEVVYAPLTFPELRIDRAQLESELARVNEAAPCLFAFPGQSNFSGVKHPLDLIPQAQAKGWDVLLDAAALAPANRLDLGRWQPDFVTLSFYKMFGYPTGLGCLIAKKEKLARWRRPWFAGGTVTLVSVQAMTHFMADGEAGFEDGTVDYLGIPALQIGLEHLESIGMETIEERVRCLTGWLLDNLVAMRHSNGRPLARIYGPITTQERGGTITFNLYDPEGRLVDYRRIEELAGREKISLRTGCFCNPGVGEAAERLTAEEIMAGFDQLSHPTLPQFVHTIEHISGKSAGAVRISVGLASNFGDAHRFLQFAQTFVDRPTDKVGPVEFNIEDCRVIRDGS